MIRKHIINKKINTSEIHHVIGHNGSVFFKILFKYFCYLLVSLLLFLLLDRYVKRGYFDRCFAWIWFILFIKFALDFCDLYLDCLVLTDTWITLYLWEWLLEYKTDNFSRNSIETISFNQKWIWDKIFMKWDITIRLEHWVDFPFENISNPKKEVDKIIQMKTRFMAPVQKAEEEKSEEENKKFDILVEALWEVVQDYIWKWNPKTWTDESYFV